ncbi:hypothetical protein [Aquimarina longa]|uniref:hypothetical protein n=1 Tax=Aquimarina longa TaxID=1080221 RepID=UPI000782B3AC|nr:hypothetical protein [Aquimarina longa]
MITILSYLLLGIFITILSALPLGVVNLVVINTTIKEGIKNVSHIIIAAGVGEVILAFFALHYSTELSIFFQENQWVQIVFIILFLSIGIYFVLFKNNPNFIHKPKKLRLLGSKLLSGFFLAILNPPVLIYWILAISLINKSIVKLTSQTSLITLFLFFLGVYLGKIGTLYFYSKWGYKMTQKQKNETNKTSKTIGIILIMVSIIQSIRLFI